MRPHMGAPGFGASGIDHEARYRMNVLLSAGDNLGEISSDTLRRALKFFALASSMIN
jgi:hypothetical protein